MGRLHAVHQAVSKSGHIAIVTMQPDLGAALWQQMQSGAPGVSDRHRGGVYTARVVVDRVDPPGVTVAGSAGAGGRHTSTWVFAPSGIAPPGLSRAADPTLAVFYATSGCLTTDVDVVGAAVEAGLLSRGTVVVLRVRLPVAKKRRKHANAFLAKALEQRGVFGHIRIHHLLSDRVGERTVSMTYEGSGESPVPTQP
eukprot:m.770168 g.770168  ORF g.770168 m.770168 type:complete len:197 (+) comp23239_c0_seq3:2550-3140(+)